MKRVSAIAILMMGVLLFVACNKEEASVMGDYRQAPGFSLQDWDSVQAGTFVM